MLRLFGYNLDINSHLQVGKDRLCLPDNKVRPLAEECIKYLLCMCRPWQLVPQLLHHKRRCVMMHLTFECARSKSLCRELLLQSDAVTWHTGCP